MSNALTKAFTDCERSYFASKASVAQVTNDLLARGPSGLPVERTDLSKASEQLKHFSGWVFSSIRPIASRIAGQPIRVGKVKTPRRLGTKAFADAKPLDSHPLLDLLADPNDLMVSWSLMFTTVASLELTGRALWWLPKRKEILPIPTSWIVGFEGSTKFTAFKVRPPAHAEAYPLPADECCYFNYPNPADPHGAISPLQAVGGAVDSDEAITASRISMFRRGIHPTHVVKVGKNAEGMRLRLTDAQQRQIISAIKKRYSGVERHGEPLILDQLIEEVTRLSNTPAEMDWLSSEKSTKARIMQGFGTNPIIAGEVEGANRASSLAAEDHFCSYTLNPKIALLSQCMTEWLGPMFGDGLVVWIDECVPRDAEMELKRIDLAAKSGVITANELRQFAGLPEDSQWEGVLVGGKNMSTTGPIEAGLRAMILESLGDVGADALLEQVHGHNGRLLVGGER